jgi:Fe-S oxidoreductase
VTLTNGRLFPHITRESLDTCIGCGACEYVCPADPKGMTVIPKSVQTVASKIN